MKLYLPDILLNPALSNQYTTNLKGVSVSGSSGASPLGVPVIAWSKSDSVAFGISSGALSA